MRKMLQRGELILLVCLLLAGCSGTGAASHTEPAVTASIAEKTAIVGDIPVTFPLVSKSTALNVMSTGYGSVEQQEVYVWQKYAEMTGVDVNWETVTRDKRVEAVHTALINNQKLDLILRCKVSASKLTQYGENGLILDLTQGDLLKTYAPNCWAYLQSHPDTLASVMNPDGAIYALPQVNSGAELRVGLKFFVNKAWLERVGMTLPTTTEEFRQMLEAFKEQDANGNGDPNDEIPLCSTNWQSIEQAIFGAFGLANRGFHNESVDCDPETGAVRLIAASDAYRDYLTYMHELYDAGLIDSRIFSITDEQWGGNVANDRIGVFASTNLAWIPADRLDNWVAIEEALEGPRGDKMWTAIRANFHSTGAAVIPATCSDPALVLRWLDYFWTDEGTLFYHMGVEGETFNAQADGSYDYVPAIYEKMKTGNDSFDDVVATYSPYPGGSNPTVEIAPYFMGGEMAAVPAEAARALFAYGPEEYWPSFTFTAEESEELDLVQSDIFKFISAIRIKFVTGELPLSEWDAYSKQLEALHVDKMLVIYQAAVDRYHALDTVLG